MLFNRPKVVATIGPVKIVNKLHGVKPFSDKYCKIIADECGKRAVENIGPAITGCVLVDVICLGLKKAHVI